MTRPNVSDTHAMSGNVQGFELPRGCLMVSGAILLPIVTFTAGLLIGGISSAVVVTAAVVAALVTVKMIRNRADGTHA